MRRPRLAVLSGLTGLILAAAGAVAVLAAAGDGALRPVDFARADLPGQVAATLDRAGVHLVFHEHAADAGPDSLLTAAQVQVLDPLGAPVPLRAPEEEVTYRRDGRVGTAIAVFDAQRSGTYVAAVLAADAIDGAVAIAEEPAPGAVRVIAGTVATALGVLLVAWAVRRGRGQTPTVPAADPRMSHLRKDVS